MLLKERVVVSNDRFCVNSDIAAGRLSYRIISLDRPLAELAWNPMQYHPDSVPLPGPCLFEIREEISGEPARSVLCAAGINGARERLVIRTGKASAYGKNARMIRFVWEGNAQPIHYSYVWLENTKTQRRYHFLSELICSPASDTFICRIPDGDLSNPGIYQVRWDPMIESWYDVQVREG